MPDFFLEVQHDQCIYFGLEGFQCLTELFFVYMFQVLVAFSTSI